MNAEFRRTNVRVVRRSPAALTSPPFPITLLRFWSPALWSTVAGQEAARERLHQMARRLCAQVEDELDLSPQSNYVKCVDEATAKTLPHLDAMSRSTAVNLPEHVRIQFFLD